MRLFSCLVVTIIMVVLSHVNGIKAQSFETTQIIETGSVGHLRWSPDGNYLALVNYDPDLSIYGSSISIWDVTTGEIIFSFEGERANQIRTIEWSPDGQFIASFDDNFNVRIWDMESGEMFQSLNMRDYWANLIYAFLWRGSLAWKSDGSELLIAGDNHIGIWEANTNSLREDFQGKIVVGATWSPDNEELALVTETGEIDIFDAGTFDLIHRLPPVTRQIIFADSTAQYLAWQPNEENIATFHNEYHAASNVILIQEVNNTSQDPYVLEGHTGEIESIVWSPDGSLLASASVDQTVRIWNGVTLQTVTILEGHSDIVTSLSWSPDGNMLASGSWDGTTRIWQVKTRRTEAIFTG